MLLGVRENERKIFNVKKNTSLKSWNTEIRSISSQDKRTTLFTFFKKQLPSWKTSEQYGKHTFLETTTCA